MAERISFLSAAEDQTIAGLIMWIPGALGYFTVLTGIFYVWVEKRPASEGESPFRKVDPGRVRRRASANAPATTIVP
jgi:cytochrome c oxidase assembly factor CtaG